MTIETKYDIGQEVWLCLCDEYICGKIIEVGINITEKKKEIFYEITTKEGHCLILEQCLFPTKEELLKSL